MPSGFGFESLFQDLRYSARQFRRNPGFAITAILTLALGIGASAAVFSVAYGVLIDPFPYKDVHTLATPKLCWPELGECGWRAYTPQQFNEIIQPVPEKKLRAVYVSPNVRARESGLTMIPNWRVPKSSVIHRVFESAQDGEAVEDLAAWESSDGSRLASRRVRIRAKKLGESVHVLVSAAT